MALLTKKTANVRTRDASNSGWATDDQSSMILQGRIPSFQLPLLKSTHISTPFMVPQIVLPGPRGCSVFLQRQMIKPKKQKPESHLINQIVTILKEFDRYLTRWTRDKNTDSVTSCLDCTEHFFLFLPSIWYFNAAVLCATVVVQLSSWRRLGLCSAYEGCDIRCF